MSRGPSKRELGWTEVESKKQFCLEDIGLEIESQVEGIIELSESLQHLADFNKEVPCTLELAELDEPPSPMEVFALGHDNGERGQKCNGRKSKTEARKITGGEGKKIPFAFSGTQGQPRNGQFRGQSSRAPQDFSLAGEAGRIMPLP